MKLLDRNPADMDWGQLEEASKSVADLYNRGKITLEEKRRRQDLYRNWQVQRELETRQKIQAVLKRRQSEDLPPMLEIERFADHRGALYTANGRAAMWQFIDAGCTQVALFETLDGYEYCYDGWIIQSEKADGVCEAWVTERLVSYNFNYSTSSINRPATL